MVQGIVLEGRGDEMPEFHICDNHITGAKSTGIDASTWGKGGISGMQFPEKT